MKFYLGTALARRDEARDVARRLVAAGHEQTFDWTALPDMRPRPLGDAERGEAARREIEGIRAADFGVILLPGGRGTHAELGAMLALGKPAFVHARSGDVLGSGGYVCAFYEHPLVDLFVGDVADLVVAVGR